MSFCGDYFSARSHFQAMVRQGGGGLTSLDLTAKGPHGEQLAIDIGWFGSPNPRRALLHSSGLHGVEGFAGSAIQLQWSNAVPAIPEDGAIVLVHVLNPYGMAWLRRVNEHNVDLNRNFVFDGQYTGAPRQYSRIDSFLNPTSPPSKDLFAARAAWLAVRHGMNAMKQAVAGGQYEFPKGLFFGGRNLQEGPAMYKAFLEQRLSSARIVVAIDVHTGLGPHALDTLLVEPDHYERLRGIFGDRVTAPNAGLAYTVRGGIHPMIIQACRQADVLCVGQEFGTFPAFRILHALREENRWHHYGMGPLNHPSKDTLKEVFCPADASWRQAVLERGRALLQAACAFAFS